MMSMNIIRYIPSDIIYDNIRFYIYLVLQDCSKYGSLWINYCLLTFMNHEEYEYLNYIASNNISEIVSIKKIWT